MSWEPAQYTQTQNSYHFKFWPFLVRKTLYYLESHYSQSTEPGFNPAKSWPGSCEQTQCGYPAPTFFQFTYWEQPWSQYLTRVTKHNKSEITFSCNILHLAGVVTWQKLRLHIFTLTYPSFLTRLGIITWGFYSTKVVLCHKKWYQ